MIKVKYSVSFELHPEEVPALKAEIRRLEANFKSNESSLVLFDLNTNEGKIQALLGQKVWVKIHFIKEPILTGLLKQEGEGFIVTGMFFSLSDVEDIKQNTIFMKGNFVLPKLKGS